MTWLLYCAGAATVPLVVRCAYLLFLIDGVDLIETFELFLDLDQFVVDSDGQIKESLGIYQFLSLYFILLHFLLVLLQQLNTLVNQSLQRTVIIKWIEI